MSKYNYLVCLDMDRVLVDHLSTWQYVYDKLNISNDESFELYNQGLLDEWDWIKLDIALIKGSITDRKITDKELRSLMEGMPMMKISPRNCELAGTSNEEKANDSKNSSTRNAGKN